MTFEYERSAICRGNAAGALEWMGEGLAAGKFRVSPVGANELRFENALPYPLIKTDPLYVVSRGSVLAADATLTVKAELRYLHETTRQVLFFIGVIGLTLAAVLIAIIVLVAKTPGFLWIGLPFVGFPVLMVLLGQKAQRWATWRALDALLAEAVDGVPKEGASPAYRAK